MTMQPMDSDRGSLADVIDKVLDKGLIINADISVSLVGVELLGIKIRAALASFETAARYGLAFPTGTDKTVKAYVEAQEERETCPSCRKRTTRNELLEEGCPWCGWASVRSPSREMALYNA